MRKDLDKSAKFFFISITQTNFKRFKFPAAIFIQTVLLLVFMMKAMNTKPQYAESPSLVKVISIYDNSNNTGKMAVNPARDKRKFNNGFSNCIHLDKLIESSKHKNNPQAEVPELNC